MGGREAAGNAGAEMSKRPEGRATNPAPLQYTSR